ncbi:hypothetical protein HYV69_01175 [Candidatus Uhrbacteria bacterium]|nr:hypothetical protein [Candidatus Uhrbacteria bacterium]
MTTNEYIATVEKIIQNGKHGPYAVARCEELDSITFSLDRKVWKEDDLPEPGMIVVLSKVRKKRAGWRALVGRHITPSDKATSSSKE